MRTMRLHALVILLVAIAATESNARKHKHRGALRRNTEKNQLMRRLTKDDDTKKSGTGKDAVEKKKEKENEDGGTETRTVIGGEELILPLNATEAEAEEVECTGDLPILSSAPGYNNHQCEKSCQCASGCCAYVQSRVCVGLSAAITEDKCLQ